MDPTRFWRSWKLPLRQVPIFIRCEKCLKAMIETLKQNPGGLSKKFRNKMMTWASFKDKNYDRNDLGRIRFKTFRFNLMIEDVRCEQKLHELFVNFVAMVFFHGLHCRQCCKTFTLLRPLATSTPTAFCALHGRGLHDMAKMRSIFFNGWRLFFGKKRSSTKQWDPIVFQGLRVGDVRNWCDQSIPRRGGNFLWWMHC